MTIRQIRRLKRWIGSSSNPRLACKGSSSIGDKRRRDRRPKSPHILKPSPGANCPRGLIALEDFPSPAFERHLRCTSTGLLKAPADSCRGVIRFLVIVVGTAVPLEFALGVDPIAPSVVAIDYWYAVRFLAKQDIKRRTSGERMEMAQTAFELEAGDATPVPDAPPGHLRR